MLAHILEYPVQNLLSRRDGLWWVFEPLVKDKVHRVNLCYSLVYKLISSVSTHFSREQAVLQISACPHRQQSVQKGLAHSPRRVLPPILLKIVPKAFDKRVPSLLIADKVRNSEGAPHD